jgi:hypothetical protein
MDTSSRPRSTNGPNLSRALESAALKLRSIREGLTCSLDLIGQSNPSLRH